MKDYLSDLVGEPSVQKIIVSVSLTIGNALGGVTLDGAYKVLLFVLAAANLVWAILNIRKLRKEERARELEREAAR